MTGGGGEQGWGRRSERHVSSATTTMARREAPSRPVGPGAIGGVADDAYQRKSKGRDSKKGVFEKTFCEKEMNRMKLPCKSYFCKSLDGRIESAMGRCRVGRNGPRQQYTYPGIPSVNGIVFVPFRY